MLAAHQQAARPFGSARPRCASGRAAGRRLLVARAAAAPGPLPSEAEAVAAYRAANGEGLAPCLSLLKRAATDKSVAPQLVEGALAELERSHASPASSVDGRWRLVFSTATSNRALQYIPVVEDLVIDLAAQTCALESVVGPFSFNIRGGVTGFAGGALDFQFTAVDILLLGRKIWTVTPKTKPKTYTFFYEGEGIAAARSSAGGLALLRK
ncbi:hypothetical protein HT031_001298 [Scenedesmus sp. PABB004]|nr:hypothetical protein HT031_001298 [Scenedesmus sp. PABB004]